MPFPGLCQHQGHGTQTYTQAKTPAKQQNKSKFKSVGNCNMAPWGKGIATKPKDLSSVPRTHAESHVLSPRPLILFGILREGLERWDDRRASLRAASVWYSCSRRRLPPSKQWG